MGDVWLEGKELEGVFLARVPVVALVAVMEKSKGHYITLTLANNVWVNPLRETTKTVLFKSGPVYLWWWTFRFVALVLRILPCRTWRKRNSTGRVGDWSSGSRFSKVPYVSGPERWLFIAAFTDSSLEIQNARNVVQRNLLVLNQDQGSKIYGKFLVISRKGLLQPSTVITPSPPPPLCH